MVSFVIDDWLLYYIVNNNIDVANEGTISGSMAEKI